jgi:epoxyqueuosine reductase
VPPTYLFGPAIERKAKAIVCEALEPSGYRAVGALLPRKLLAVGSGLAEYGRNNIAYVAGLGSFHRICAYFSDMPCEEDTWLGAAMMPLCEKCTICASECPSDAIDPERFLVWAERCITYHNEQDHNVPFPEWLDPSWHNCLIGCLICQRACPADSEVIDWTEEGVEFTEEETRFILDFNPEGVEIWTKEGPKVPDCVPASLGKKLEEADLLGILELMPRNLAALYGATVK